MCVSLVSIPKVVQPKIKVDELGLSIDNQRRVRLMMAMHDLEFWCYDGKHTVTIKFKGFQEEDYYSSLGGINREIENDFF